MRETCGNRKKRKWTIEKLGEFVRGKGGKCLSKQYVNFKSKLKWQCAFGHCWQACPSDILSGSPCPSCAGNKKKTIEQMQELAAKRGGQCLSKQYINARSKLEWQCAFGHCWQASPDSVATMGSWCPSCVGNKKKTIEQMQELAAKRGGQCLSSKYVNVYCKLEWECALGHRFFDCAHNVIRGCWCVSCRGRKKNTTKQKKIAALDTNYKLTVDQICQCKSIENVTGLSDSFLRQVKEKHPDLMLWWKK